VEIKNMNTKKIEDLENAIEELTKELYDLKNEPQLAVGDWVRVSNHSGVWLVVDIVGDFKIKSIFLTKGNVKITRFQMSGIERAWRPEEGEHYFIPILLHSLYQECPFYESCKANLWRFTHGIVFRTKEEAISKAKEMLGIEGEI